MDSHQNSRSDPTHSPSLEERIAALDWAATPMGPRSAWPQSLKATIKTMLASRYPMIIVWGERLIQIYNDAYTNLIGDKHPGALGKSIIETQAESWPTIGPMIKHVLSTGISNWVPAQMLALSRAGYQEETYFSLSYSAVENDDNLIDGMLCVCSEVTQQVLGERRLKLQRDLSSKAGITRGIDKVCKDIATAVSEYHADVPFILLYTVEPDRKLQLRASANFDVSTLPSTDVWSIEQALRGETVITNGIDSWISIRSGPWNDVVKSVISLPIPSSDPNTPLGVMIAGVSPNCALNDNYYSFFELLGDQVSVALRNALAHEEERKRTEALAEIDRAKTAFFNNISHEFRTPLTLMLGPLEDLLGAPEQPGVAIDREQLLMIYQNALRLLKLVNTLLDFSRIEANRVEASYTATDLAELTRDLAGAFESAIEKAGLAYTVGCRPLSESIFVDVEMWEKIVLNLLSNALKFTFEGSIQVVLSETQDHAVLEVRDSGVGIPGEDVGNIFKRFHRVQNSRSRSFEGTGIGLALVKELVELHDGEITAESTVGRGTTFTVRIPKGTAHLDPVMVTPAKQKPSETQRARAYLNEANVWAHGKNKKEDDQENVATPVSYNDSITVLAVDDNTQMLEYLKRLLSAKWKVETASDGLEAIKIINERLPNLILSDVMMPNMDGFQLLAWVRKDSRLHDIPFILLSARAGQEATIEGLEKGANDYLVKPFFSRELIARLEAQLEISGTKKNNVWLQQQVHERNAELEKINRELEAFAYVASHDLQEPLRKIRTYSSLMEGEKGDKQSTGLYLNKISRASERMSKLITDLLNFSRLSEKSVVMELTNLEKVAADVQGDFELLIQQRNAVIECMPLPTIDSIPLQINQLFYNLLSNALKFTRDQQPVIRISSQKMDAHEVAKYPSLTSGLNYYMLLFEDNGIGFDQKYATQIFTIFQRLNPMREFSGTGIGLALCKKIVLNHRGDIFAVSEEGKGSTFKVILPERQIAL
ncbi:MAG TPA: ATP-binding protein [Cyclobacteriaceae bacterium]|nr:ATP-binding protein [Cyclobacteriaceae bacterium]